MRLSPRSCVLAILCGAFFAACVEYDTSLLDPARCSLPWLDCDRVGPCETNSATDPHSCGACGHDCLGGACVDALCQPVVLVTDQAKPAGIVASEDRLYWTNLSGGTVMTAKKDGTTARALARDQLQPGAIVLSGGSLYWVNFGEPDMMGLARPNTGAIMSLPLGASQPQTLIREANRPVAIAAHGAYVYYTSPSTIRRVPTQGSPENVSVSVARNQAQTGALAVDAIGIYWTDLKAGAVRFAMHADLDYTVQDLALAQKAPAGLAIDLIHAYWSNMGDNTIMRTTKYTAGQRDPEIERVAETRPFPVVVVLDDLYVYWTARDDGSVEMVWKSGGSPVSLASGQAGPAGLAVDDQAVYWTNADSGQIMRVALPPR